MTSLSPKPNAALVLIGHGSTLNPDSSAPTLLHADELRRRGIFAEVVCAFWKEEPSMREVYAMIESPEVYLVPNFISEGYFCQQVLPRELRVTGPVSEWRDKTLYYCDPVGIHPNMTGLLLQRADEVAPQVPRSETSLVIVGHGTNLNENSRKVIEQQVALIRDGGYGFAEVVDTYMEEAPLVSDWQTLTHSPNVVVVPFFIADGLHSYQDIPVLLGIEEEGSAAASQRDVFRHNPHHVNGRNLFYSSAIGTEPHMADVILDQVADFDKKHQPAPKPAGTKRLDAWLESKANEGLKIGQVQILKATTGYRVSHADDAASELATASTDWREARSLANVDKDGAFRPLKTAPTLRSGWQLNLPSVADLRLALDALYPGAVGMAMHAELGSLDVTPLRGNLGRQTGMYRFTNSIRDDQALDMVARCCDSKTKCLRQIAWDLAPGQPLSGPAAAKCPQAPEPGTLPLFCVEVCPFLVSEARKIAQANHQAAAKESP